MRDQVGVLLMEDTNGEVAVQLFAEVSGASKAFENLTGSPLDPPRRATFIGMRFVDGKLDAHLVHSKVLPILEPIEDRPDGYLLGVGPVTLKK